VDGGKHSGDIDVASSCSSHHITAHISEV